MTVGELIQLVENTQTDDYFQAFVRERAMLITELGQQRADEELISIYGNRDYENNNFNAQLNIDKYKR